MEDHVRTITRGLRRGAVALAALTVGAGALITPAPVAAVVTETSAVFVNELHYDNAGTDTGEFVEIVGPAGTDLTGWSVVLYNGSNGEVYDTIALGGSFADSGEGYGFSVVELPSNGLQNGSPDGLALVDASDTLVEFLSYEGAFSAVGGPADGEASTDIGVSEPGTTPIGQSLQRTGAGSTAGDFVWTGPATESRGSTNAGQSFGDAPPPTVEILINEVDADNAGTDVAEFIELTSGATGGVSLDGFVLVFYNGSDDASYAAFDLDGQSTGTDGYFVLCGDAANVAGCDLDVAPDSNLIQNGADAVALFNGDATDFPNDTPVTDVNLVDAIVYDTNDSDDPGLLSLLTAGGQVNEGANGNSTIDSNSRCPDGAGSGRDTSNYVAAPPTPGAPNDCEGGGGDPIEVFIHEVQGAGAASPLVGEAVTISGIVVGDFQEIVTADPDDAPLGGFFVQEEDADADADPATSEGIFVFAPASAPVAVGDLVEVTGTAKEFFGLTEIGDVTDISVISSANPLPTPATPIVPTAVGGTPVDWEAIEGMSVVFGQPLFVSDLFPLGRYGEIGLSAIGPNDHPNQVADVGSTEAVDVRQLNIDSRVVLDDGEDENESFPSGISSWNPTPTPYLDGPEGTVRAGDRIDQLSGVVHYSFGEYEVQPVNLADATNPDGGVDIVRTPRPTSVPDVGGDLTVASFNVLNYFVTIDSGGATCGPPSNPQGCRGADSQEEFDLQSAKITDAIADLDADIVGLIELENSANDEAIADLVAKVNARSLRTYTYVSTGYIGTDAIVVGIMYDSATVAPDGAIGVLDSTVSPAFIDDKNRPALAQTFVDLGSGENMTVVVNHLKSKGSACDDVDNPGDPAFGVEPYALGADADVGPQGDPLFTGNCNLTRTAAAKVLGQWVDEDPTGTPSDNLLILGDLNAYANEDPITELEGQGYTNLKSAFTASNSWADGGHSYVFDGEFGTLDYAMANPALTAQVTGAEAWHINADEPFAIDYQNFNPPGQATPDEWKSSDHDPVIIGLDLVADAATARELKQAARDDLAAAVPTGSWWSDFLIDRAITRLDASLRDAYWVDDSTLDPRLGWRVFVNEAIAAKWLLIVRGPGQDAAEAALAQLVAADELLATDALSAAVANGGDERDIARAERELDRAATDLERGRPDRAIGHYRRAWWYAQRAVVA